MAYCSRSRRCRFSVLDFKSWAYNLIYGHFSNICTVHAQKGLFMNFRCKFRHRRSIRRPRFPVRVQNFGDLATFSADLCILYAECPPYFYFRFVWPSGVNASSRLGDEPLIGLGVGGDWSELVASYSRMKTAWGWANGEQPILVCYIRKYVII